MGGVYMGNGDFVWECEPARALENTSGRCNVQRWDDQGIEMNGGLCLGEVVIYALYIC